MAEYGQVAVVTKAAVEEGCTTYAQGGVCAVLDPLDSVEKHVHDTMVAGAHLNIPEYVSCCLCCKSSAFQALLCSMQHQLSLEVTSLLTVEPYVHSCKPKLQHCYSATLVKFRGIMLLCY